MGGMGGWVGGPRGRGFRYTYSWFTSLYRRNWHNIVKQFYSKTKTKTKKTPFFPSSSPSNFKITQILWALVFLLFGEQISPSWPTTNSYFSSSVLSNAHTNSTHKSRKQAGKCCLILWRMGGLVGEGFPHRCSSWNVLCPPSLTPSSMGLLRAPRIW